MIPALVLAALLGVLATYGLSGRGYSEAGLARGFVLGLPLVAVSGAGLTGITLPWAVGMAVAVTVGLLLAPMVLRSPAGPFAAAVGMTAGIVMAAGMLRWLMPVVAALTGLNARVLALVTLAAAAAWAAGNRGSLLRTTFWVSIVTAVLLFAAGFLIGEPGTLTSPLADLGQKSTPAILWLIMVIVFAALHPAPSKGPVSAIVVGVALLTGLIGLLSFLGGYLEYPSNGLIGVAGYASSNGAIPGLVLSIIPMIVSVVATGAIMRAALTPWEGFTAPGRLSAPALQIVVLAAVVGFFTFVPAPTWVFVVGVALAGIGALIFGRRTSDSEVEAPVGA